MALTLPKLALPNMRILIMVVALVAVAAAAWFGWQYYEDQTPAPPPPPTAKPAGPAKAVAPAPAPDKLIADVLAASGLNQQLDQLPRQLITGVRQSSKQRAKPAPAVLAAIEKAVTESFTAQNFRDRLSANLKKNFEQKRMQALLADLSTPAAKRMIEMEQATPAPEELSRFARSPAANMLSAERKQLIKRIDAATRASDLAIESAFVSMKAVAMGIVGGQAQKAAAVDKAIEKQRASATANIRNATLVNLAFTYKDASDADLEGYAKFYEAENSKWLSGIVYASLLEEATSASAQAGERVGAMTSKPVNSDATAAGPVRLKSRADARACLDLATNAAIIKCAQPYR